MESKGDTKYSLKYRALMQRYRSYWILETAFILINVEVDSEKEVLKSLKEIFGIAVVHLINNFCDIIIRAEAETLQELNELIDRRILKINKIISSITIIRLET